MTETITYDPQEIGRWAQSVGLRLATQRYIEDIEWNVTKLRAERDKFRQQAAESLGELISLRDKVTFLESENKLLKKKREP